MLQLLWNQLAYLGVPGCPDQSEHKHIILVNTLSIVVALFTLLNLPAALVVPGIPFSLGLSSIVYPASLLVVLILNARQQTTAARIAFTVVSYAYLVFNAFTTGSESYFRFFLLTEMLVVFFTFPAAEARLMYASASIVLATFVGFEFLPAHYWPSPALAEGMAKNQQISGRVGFASLIFAFSFYIHRTFRSAERIIKSERDKSERLLLNILPPSIVTRLRENPDTIAERFENCTVLFSDLVGFTGLARQMSPVHVVALLNDIFSDFDDLAGKHGLEKIKTIGDAYMVVGGLPEPDPLHAERVARFALDMLDVVRAHRQRSDLPLELRIGINSGDAVAGVIGKRKFIYDLWGDSVNTASRMESHGLPGQIQVTESTYHLLKEKFRLEERGLIDVKGLGSVRSYLLLEGA